MREKGVDPANRARTEGWEIADYLLDVVSRQNDLADLKRRRENIVDQYEKGKLAKGEYLVERGLVATGIHEHTSDLVRDHVYINNYAASILRRNWRQKVVRFLFRRGSTDRGTDVY